MTLDEASCVPLVLFARSVSVPVPAVEPPVNPVVIVVEPVLGKVTEVGERVQLFAAKAPLHTLNTRLMVRVPALMLVSVNVVLVVAFVLTLAVPP